MIPINFKSILRHPVGWLVLFLFSTIVGYFCYWDRTPTKIVDDYIHSISKGDWNHAKELTSGPLQQKLNGSDVTNVQKVTVLSNSYQLIQQDIRKKISVVRAKVATQFDGGKIDVQDQVYALYQSEKGWKIYRVDQSNLNMQDASNLYPIGFKKINANETILKFLMTSTKNDWKNAESLLTGSALQDFQKTLSYLPKKWSQNISIVEPKITYLGSPIIGNDYDFIVNYGVENQGVLNNITAHMTLTKWDNQFLINKVEIIDDKQGESS